MTTPELNPDQHDAVKYGDDPHAYAAEKLRQLAIGWTEKEYRLVDSSLIVAADRVAHDNDDHINLAAVLTALRPFLRSARSMHELAQMRERGEVP